ncbi:MAG: hypothetical protein JWP35_302 [Caulobacter sp.]|nr:hypothetical protein [Caulobacter sp.]
MRSAFITGLAVVAALAAALTPAGVGAAPVRAVAATTVPSPDPFRYPPIASALAGRLDGLAGGAFAKEPVGSLTVGVVRDGRLAWTASYGTADLGTGARAGETTVYRVASVTKQFTALMLLQLVNEGVVHLSDPVSRFVPEIRQIRGGRAGAAPVTLFQLATHTSGLAVESDDATTYAKGPVAGWETALLTALPRTRYAAEPGIRYAYSNIDYAILALALSRAAKTPYVKYLHNRIFMPLGMTHTTFNPPVPPGQLARGYVIQAGLPHGETPQRELAGRGYKAPSGGAFSTVDDLARFVAFQMGYGPDKVLPRSVLLANRELLVAGNARLDGGYGVGFQVFQANGYVLLGHLGGIAGYRSLTAFDPEARVGVIVLRNISEGEFDPLALGKSLVRAARD